MAKSKRSANRTASRMGKFLAKAGKRKPAPLRGFRMVLGGPKRGAGPRVIGGGGK